MNLAYLDKKEYRDIPLLKIVDNSGGLPFFIHRHTMTAGNFTSVLHRHEYMQINYVYQGKAEYLLNNKHFKIIKGDIFVIPSYMPHSIIETNDTCAEIFEFEFMPGFIKQDIKNIKNTGIFMDFTYMEPFSFSENQVKPCLNLAGRKQVEVEDILNEALREYNRRKSRYILMIRSLLLKLLVLIEREFTANQGDGKFYPVYVRHQDSISNAMKYIDSHYTEDLSIEKVAREFALSQSYFSYLFKNITSRTFTEYLNNCRISKALELLKKTDKKVIDISLDVGFNNVYHFNRMFKQQMGISPLEYKKQEGL